MCAEAERAVVATVVGFVACLCCVEAGAVAWRFGPSHACQGVGCRYCDVSVPGDGRASCERTLGRGIRPALNSLLNARSGGRRHARPGAARAPLGGRGRFPAVMISRGHGPHAHVAGYGRRRQLQDLGAISAFGESRRVEIAISSRRVPRSHLSP